MSAFVRTAPPRSSFRSPRRILSLCVKSTFERTMATYPGLKEKLKQLHKYSACDVGKLSRRFGHPTDAPGI
jgi:hypothetical protein